MSDVPVKAMATRSFSFPSNWTWAVISASGIQWLDENQVLALREQGKQTSLEPVSAQSEPLETQKPSKGKPAKTLPLHLAIFMGDCNITSLECRLWNTVNENRTLISHRTQACTIPGQISCIMLHFYCKNPAMHLLYASPFIGIWKRLVSPDSVPPHLGKELP